MGIKHNFALYIIVALAAMCTLASCDKAEYSGPPRFTLYLEDAPADYTSLRTALEKIELQHADGTWLVIKEPNTLTFDILQLSGGQMLRVAEQEIPADKYVKLRVTFSSNGAELVEGTASIKLPIAPKNQVQEFVIDMTAGENLDSYLILDINAVTSVITDNVQARSFSPACHVVNTEGMGTLWGMIGDSKGVPIAETMLVEVRRRLTDEVTMSYVNRRTAAIFQRLTPGTYDVVITPGPNSKYMGTTVNNVTIDAQQSTQMGMLRLASLPQKKNQ